MGRTLAVIAATIILACVSVFTAGTHVRADYRGSRRSRGRGQYERYQDNAGAFWGGVLGGWIAQAFRPDREGSDVEGDLEPGTDAWLRYCTSKYKSFNPETGTYRSYGGDDKPCR